MLCPQWPVQPTKTWWQRSCPLVTSGSRWWLRLGPVTTTQTEPWSTSSWWDSLWPAVLSALLLSAVCAVTVYVLQGIPAEASGLPPQEPVRPTAPSNPPNPSTTTTTTTTTNTTTTAQQQPQQQPPAAPNSKNICLLSHVAFTRCKTC